MDKQMTALQNLEREAQSEALAMQKLAKKSSRDSTSVKILTVIMLIYLPCTVVAVSVTQRNNVPPSNR